ncbi:hypothetical protein ABZS79_22380 [Streptomyces griseoloalbus]|uniref:hypothetical protein n=1 Tax=Streptomyces griseoloalbus TaxID=67303 RepID=UPI0033A7CA8A
MGRGHLSLALLTEGASDQWFLVPLIDRQVAELALRAPAYRRRTAELRRAMEGLRLL